MTSGAESTTRKTSPPIDGGEREIGADREIDAARQDDELLAHRDDGDDRCLSDDVAEVAGLQKVRRRAG